MFTFYWEDYSWLMALLCFVSIFIMWLRRAPMPREQSRPAADWERSIIMPKANDAILGSSGRLSRESRLAPQHRTKLQASSPTRRSALAASGSGDEDLFDVDASSKTGGIVVVEQTSAVLQAQFWADLGMPGETIAILAPIHAADSKPGSWLLLMDAYVRCDMQAEYEDVSARFSRQFNGQLANWEQRQLGLPQKGLNDYPELRLRIDHGLLQSGGAAWLQQLLLDDRGGKRRGFDYGVYCDLVRLYEALEASNESLS